MKLHIVAFILIVCSMNLTAQNDFQRGIYFSKKTYQGQEISSYLTLKSKILSPILEGNQERIDMFWKCWEFSFDHFKKSQEGSPFVSNFLDMAFSNTIFQWDLIFIGIFARYGDQVFPAVNSSDNFYSNQHANGYICRQLYEEAVKDRVFRDIVHTINPPLFS